MNNLLLLIRYTVYLITFGGLIFFIGPLLSIGDYRPFLSALVRMAVVFLIFAWLAIQFVRSARRAEADSRRARQAGAAGVQRHSQLAYWLFGIPGICLVALWSLSYFGNRAYLDDVAEVAQQHVQMIAEIADPTTDQLGEVVRVLDQIRPWAMHDGHYWEPSRILRLGLYQGDVVTQVYYDSYRRLLLLRLLPVLMLDLEEQMKVNAGNSSLLYRLLEIYLMMDSREHYDADTLINYFESFSSFARSSNDLNWRGHLESLFYERPVPLPMPLNERLIVDTRATLRRFPLEELLYTRLRANAAPQGFSVAGTVGAAADTVFFYRSGDSLTREIPGLYSKYGHENMWLSNSRQMSETADRVSWVLDYESSLDESDFAEVSERLDSLYFEDYAAHYARLLNDLDLVPATSTAAISRQLDGITGPQSLLRLVAAAVLDETVSLDDDEAPEAESRAKNRLSALFGAVPDLGSLMQKENMLDRRFRYLEPVAEGQLYLELEQLAVAVRALVNQEERGMPRDVNQVTEVLATARSLRNRAIGGYGFPNQFLVSVADQINVAFTETSRGARMQADWRDNVFPVCESTINNRYPFDRTSVADVTLGDFRKVFGRDGLLKSFFDTHLDEFVDSDSVSWRVKSSAPGDIRLSAGTLRLFERAAAIRNIYFAQSAAAQLDFAVTPRSLDAAARSMTLSLADQSMQYSHGPQFRVMFRWPGESPYGSSLAMVADQSVLLREEGPWGWLRLLDRGTVQPMTDDGWTADFEIDGLEVELGMNSAGGLGWLRDTVGFSCPESL